MSTFEGTAVGFNKSKKGQRRDYPLYCTTVAQTGQVQDVFNRSGNVHDSNSDKELTYVPTKTWLDNRAFMSATLKAPNQTRELKMSCEQKTRSVHNAKPAPL
ncbi:MAG: hypothetical protein AB8B63_04745 [Granulosicoccus sp.]